MRHSFSNPNPLMRLRSACTAFRKPFCILYLYAVLLNLPLITQRLTNDLDGLWNQDDHVSGSWEYSTGRWFWPLLDKLRFRISLDPLPALAGLALYVVSFLLILEILGLSVSCITYLMGFMFLSSVGLTCQLSFGFMAITFGTSFFLAVLPLWLLTHSIRNHPKASSRITVSPGPVLLAALCICLMMGLYQAGIGSTCLLSLFILLYSLVRESLDEKDSSHGAKAMRISFLLQIAAATFIGGILYVLLMKLSFAVTGTTASDYQGLSELSFTYLLSELPSAAAHGYLALRHYFADGVFRSSRLIGSFLVPVLYLPFLLILLWCLCKVKAASLRCAVLFAAGILISPVAANCFYLVAPATETHMQMTVSTGLLLPLILGLTKLPPIRYDDKCARRFVPGRVVAILVLLAGILVLYGNALQCITDQYAMLVGRRATQTLAESILAEANRQGYDLINGQLLITDSPHSSKTFCTADLYNEANSYAQYGNWSHDVAFSRVSWSKFYSNYLRINVSFAVGDTETTIASLPEVAAMPSYPAAGSVQNVYGVLVVKLGE